MSKLPYTYALGLFACLLFPLLWTGCVTSSKYPAGLNTPPVPTQYVPLADFVCLPQQSNQVSIPQPLADYYALWEALKETPSNKKLPSDMETVSQPLPPSPAQLSVSLETFQKSSLLLLKLYSEPQSNALDANTLKRLHRIHTTLLHTARVYHAYNRLQRGEYKALPELLDAEKKLSKCLEQWNATLPPLPSSAVASMLQPWTKLWHNLTPAAVIPPEWILAEAPYDSWPLVIPKDAPRLPLSAGYDRLPVELPENARSLLQEDGRICLRQFFNRPHVPSGSHLVLVCPPMPAGTAFSINDAQFSLSEETADVPFAIDLTIMLNFDLTIQRIAVCLPEQAIGKAMLPLCLAIAKDPTP